MRKIDLRTDTSSLPTEEMRDAMRDADVGNDGLGEDPTANRLERMASDMLGFDAGLFVSSGTMGNLLGVMAGIERGSGVIIGSKSHIALVEGYGLAQMGGIYPVRIDDSSGAPDLAEAEEMLAWRKMSERIGMIALENTHNLRGGAVMRPETMATYVDLARRHNIRLHLDGARIFNAAVALGSGAREIVTGASSVTFCLSKGLCSPVGSILVSDRQTVARARRQRDLMGGQMRQTGVLAAAGIVSLERMIPRLAEDHVKARRLAVGLSSIPGVKIDPASVETNLVICDVTELGVPASALVNRLSKKGVLAIAFSDSYVRFSVYRDISEDDIDPAVAAVAEAAEEVRGPRRRDPATDAGRGTC